MTVWINKLRSVLPAVCTDKDLCKHLPQLFGSRSTICRRRMSGQTPKYVVTESGNIFYLRKDVISWVTEKNEKKTFEEGKIVDKKMKKIEKSLKKDVKEMKNLEAEDKKRDKVCEMGEKAMRKKK